MDDTVAVITYNSQNPATANVKLLQKFRFKCKRCASLCCKLGGPVISRDEAKKIESEGFCRDGFLEPVNRNMTCSPFAYGNLKTRNDGSCIFLEYDKNQNAKCSIYDVRPALCRLYPFTFEQRNSNTVNLKIIPCCTGLNCPEGEELTEELISCRFLEPLLEAMKLLQRGNP